MVTSHTLHIPSHMAMAGTCCSYVSHTSADAAAVVVAVAAVVAAAAAAEVPAVVVVAVDVLILMVVDVLILVTPVPVLLVGALDHSGGTCSSSHYGHGGYSYIYSRSWVGHELLPHLLALRLQGGLHPQGRVVVRAAGSLAAAGPLAARMGEWVRVVGWIRAVVGWLPHEVVVVVGVH